MCVKGQNQIRRLKNKSGLDQRGQEALSSHRYKDKKWNKRISRKSNRGTIGGGGSGVFSLYLCLMAK